MSIARGAHLRIARATDDIAKLLPFYCEGLGFEVLGSFQDHAGFDGVMCGHRGAAYHLEFTHRRGELLHRAPTQENLLVFYLPDRADWQNAVDRMHAHGFVPVAPANPYWLTNGLTFEDPDGYRIVLLNAAGAR